MINRFNELGMTLFELLVSLSLACFLCELVIQQYLSCKKNYQVVQTKLEQQYELLLITEFIRDSVRRAGFTPCRGASKLIIHDKRKTLNLLETFSNVEVGNKYLHINRMNEAYGRVIKKLNTSQLLVTPFSFTQGHPIMLADCYQALVYDNYRSFKTRAGITITFDAPLPEDFTEPYFIGEWVEERFYIKKNAKGKLALFYKLLKAEELSSLIHNLSASIMNERAHELIQVKLDLNSQEEIMITTRVRNS